MTERTPQEQALAIADTPLVGRLSGYDDPLSDVGRTLAAARGTVGGPSVTEAARVLNGARRLYRHRCPYCQAVFVGTSARVYCSHACSSLASYYRRLGRPYPGRRPRPPVERRSTL